MQGLDGPCYPPRTLEPERLTTKELRNRPRGSLFAEGGACVLLGFTFSTDSLHNESVNAHAPYPTGTRQRTTQLESSSPVSYTRGVTQTGATELSRICFRSPWFYIVVELLTGRNVAYYANDQWIYPFKYPIVYQKEIRKFVELLNEIELSSSVDDLLSTLKVVAERVNSSFGHKRRDVSYSEDNVAKVLGKAGIEFKNHFEKAEKAKKTALADNGRAGSAASVGPSNPSDGHSGTGRISPKSPSAVERQYLLSTCTCLKDARDHLQLLCNVIDAELSGLVSLHEAISNRSVKKIMF